MASLISRIQEGIAEVLKDTLQEHVQQLVKRQAPVVEVAQEADQSP